MSLYINREPCIPPYGVFHGSLQPRSPHCAGRPIPLHQDSLLAAQLYRCGQVRLFMFLSALFPTLLGTFLGVFALLVEILDDVLSGNDANETLLIVQYRHKILVQCLPDQILHICVCLNRTVVTPAAYGCDRYLLSPFQIQVELVLDSP